METTVFSTNGAGKTGYSHTEEQSCTLYTQINSKGIRDLNIRPQTINLVDKNRWEKLPDIGFSNDLLATTVKAGDKRKK